MKKSCGILLIIVLLCLQGFAFAAAPGDTVEVPITVKGITENLYALEASFSFDASVLEYAKTTMNTLSGYTTMKEPSKDSYSFAIANYSYTQPLQNDTVVCTITFKIKPNTPAGKYNIKIDDYLATDTNVNVSTDFLVTAGSINVNCATHKWDNGKVTLSATCATKGIMTYTCTNGTCGATKTSDIPMTDHTPSTAVQENKKPATCKENGSFETVVYCSGCRAELSRTKTSVDKLTHTPSNAVQENKMPATCKANGSYDNVIYCSVCKDELSRSKVVIEKLAHTPGKAVRENEIAATCKANGHYDEVIYCSECKTELARSTTIIPQLTKHTDANNNNSCDICGELVQPIAPTITKPISAQSVDVCAGLTATMQVEANGARGYQWFINRNDGTGYKKIKGATNAAYTTSSVEKNNDGYTYYCIVSNIYGETKSPVFTLNVVEKPNVPKTGDSTPLGLWFAMLLLGTGCLIMITKKRQHT